MQGTTRCITLRVIKFKDSKSIATVLTREYGRLSFLVNDGKSRESVRRRALMMPGSVFDCVADVRENRSLQTLRDVTVAGPMILDNPMKSTIILFMCDFLNALVRDSQPDTLLFDYVEQSIASVVEGRSSIANCAICFMVGLQRFMGIEPDLSTYQEGYLLDMTNGLFRSTPPLQGRYLDPSESAVAVQLARMTPENMHAYRFTREERQRVLDLLLEYFSIHFGSVRNLRSLDILRSLFD